VILATGIPGLADALLVGALGRLARLIETAPGNVEEPAVVAAADSLGLDPSVIKRSPPVRAAGIEKPEAPPRIPKEHQVLSQYPHGFGQRGFLRKLGSDSHRLPVAPEELARG
jgi:hypothetical protein